MLLLQLLQTPGLLLKLCIKVSECMSEALKEFVPSSEYSSDFKASNFPIMIAFDRELFACLSLYFFALDSYSKEEVGTSIAFCRLALDKLNVQRGNYDCFKPGLPPINVKGFSHLILGVENIKSVINSKLSAFDRENRLVFFQTIPTSPNLPTLPVGISVMEPISFDPPKYDNLIEFTYNPKKTKGSGGIFGSIFEDWGQVQSRMPVEGKVQVTGRDIKGDGDSKEMPVSRGVTLSEEVRNIDAACNNAGDVGQIDQANASLTDEEFARRLQQQLDMNHEGRN